MLASRIFSSQFPFKCDQCTQRFRAHHLMQQHVVVAHISALVEPKEEHLLPAVKTEIKEEPVDHTGENAYVGGMPVPSAASYVCNNCGEVFISCILFHEHQQLKHPGSPKDVIDPVATVKIEVKEEADEKDPTLVSRFQEFPVGDVALSESLDLSCPLCSEQFRSWLQLNKHNVEQHPEAPRSRVVIATVDLSYNCYGRITTSSSGPTTSSDEEDPDVIECLSDNDSATAGSLEQFRFECSDCARRFRTRRRLARHEVSHAAEFSYVCVHCHLRFRSEYALLHHSAREHEDLVPFKCRRCPDHFASEHELDLHYREHDRPKYKCTQCERAFKLHSRLKVHIRTVHNNLGPKSRTCKKCGRRFRHSSLLWAHYQRHHHYTRMDGTL